MHEQISFNQMINGHRLDYVSSFGPRTVGNTTAYNLRNAFDYRFIRKILTLTLKLYSLCRMGIPCKFRDDFWRPIPK